MPVGLYHSWAVTEVSQSSDLRVIARSNDGTIMGLAHKKYDVCGLQFHPESVITHMGQRMIDNWLGNRVTR